MRIELPRAEFVMAEGGVAKETMFFKAVVLYSGVLIQETKRIVGHSS